MFEDAPEYGLGGTGDCDSFPEADCIVTTGAFAPSNGNFRLAWPIPHLLRRNLTLITGWFVDEQPQNLTLGPDFVRNLTETTTGDFFTFQNEMALLHNHVHNLVGATWRVTVREACPRRIARAWRSVSRPTIHSFGYITHSSIGCGMRYVPES